MNLQEFPKLDNLTAKDLRTLAQKLRSFHDYSKELYIATFKEISPLNPEQLFDFFVENNLLDKNKNDKWSSSTILRAIAGASLSKRKTSAQSWDEVAKLIARTVVLSKDIDWNIETPSHLFLFGSMLNPEKKDFGDADLCLFTYRKDEYRTLQNIQKKWTDKYYDFLSNKCYSEFGFSDERQLKTDLISSSSFPSIHSSRDILFLAKEPYNVDKFPLFVLWENKYSNHESPELSEAFQLSQHWKNKNPEFYEIIQKNLNNALTNLGMLPIEHSEFETSCEDYMVKSLCEELIKKLKSSDKDYRDCNIVNKIVRLGSLGLKVLSKTLENLPEEHLNDSKLLNFLIEFDIDFNPEIKKQNKHTRTI